MRQEFTPASFSVLEDDCYFVGIDEPLMPELPGCSPLIIQSQLPPLPRPFIAEVQYCTTPLGGVKVGAGKVELI